jgi:hypothetical protein
MRAFGGRVVLGAGLNGNNFGPVSVAAFLAQLYPNLIARQNAVNINQYRFTADGCGFGQTVAPRTDIDNFNINLNPDQRITPGRSGTMAGTGTGIARTVFHDRSLIRDKISNPPRPSLRNGVFICHDGAGGL